MRFGFKTSPQETTWAGMLSVWEAADDIDVFESGCEVIVGLPSNEVTDFVGKHYRLTQARCEPKPVQRPHPPICIGGGGERRTLRTAARFAQHWNHAGGPVDQFTHKRDVLHA